EGARLSGTALVDGAPPPEPFELVWAVDGGGDPGLPREVLARLARPAKRFAAPPARPAADGSFLFQGLRLDASGALRWSAPYFLPEEADLHRTRALELDAPRTGVVLELVLGCEF